MLTTLALAGLLAASAGPARPGPGDPAPAFELLSTSGGTVKLSDFAGKSAVVLAFFPKAFTGG